MVISSTMNEAYALNSFPLFVLGAIAGILLIVIAVYAANRWGNYYYVGTLSGVAAVALFSAVIDVYKRQEYDPGEPSAAEIKAVNSDYAASFAEYGDAAIVVISRPSAESKDLSLIHICNHNSTIRCIATIQCGSSSTRQKRKSGSCSLDRI